MFTWIINVHSQHKNGTKESEENRWVELNNWMISFKIPSSLEALSGFQTIWKRKKCLKKEHHEYRCDADHEGSNCDHNNIIIFADYSEFWHCNLQMAHF